MSYSRENDPMLRDGGYGDYVPYVPIVHTGKPRPRIVCLCGSTRFRELYRKVNAAETMAGSIVLSVGCFAGDPEWGTNKVNLDELHKRKIDLADEVVVLTVDSYIGASTRSEIDYATAQGKPLRYINENTPGRPAIQCERCYEEFNSSNCVRPAHITK